MPSGQNPCRGAGNPERQGRRPVDLGPRQVGQCARSIFHRAIHHGEQGLALHARKRCGAASELPLNFDRDLGAAIASCVVAVGDALVGRQGNFLTPYAEHFAKRIGPLIAHPKINWTPDARSAVLHAYGVSMALAGRSRRKATRLKRRSRSFREALKELTRERAPLEWAKTQTNSHCALNARGPGERDGALGGGGRGPSRRAGGTDPRARSARLGGGADEFGMRSLTLGERESGTARLEGAVAAFRAALEELDPRARSVPMGDDADESRQCSLDARERESGGTTRLVEAVAACRAALEERHPRARSARLGEGANEFRQRASRPSAARGRDDAS